MKKFIMSFLGIFFCLSSVYSQSIGEKHNEIIIEYFRQHGEDTPMKKKELAKNLYNIYINKYPGNENISLDQVNNYFDIVFGDNDNIEGFNNSDLLRILDYSVSQNIMTPKLRDFAKSFISTNFSSVDEMVLYIDRYKTNNLLSTNELSMVDSMRDVAVNSSQLWSSVMRTKDPTAATIIADAIGGFTFAPLPFIAPLAAGAISLAVHACTKKGSC